MTIEQEWKNFDCEKDFKKLLNVEKLPQNCSRQQLSLTGTTFIFTWTSVKILFNSFQIPLLHFAIYLIMNADLPLNYYLVSLIRESQPLKIIGLRSRLEMQNRLEKVMLKKKVGNGFWFMVKIHNLHLMLNNFTTKMNLFVRLGI